MLSTICSNFLGANLEAIMDDFSSLWRGLQWPSGSPDKDPRRLCQETTSVELGEIPLHGVRWSSAWASHLKQMTDGEQGQDQGHPKPPSTYHITRFTKLLWVYRILPKLYRRLC